MSVTSPALNTSKLNISKICIVFYWNMLVLASDLFEVQVKLISSMHHKDVETSGCL